MAKKIILLCTTLLIIVTCTSCKEEKYLVKEYLDDLAYESGLTESKNSEESFNKLASWGVIKISDSRIVNNDVDYGYLATTICKLINSPEKNLDYLIRKGWVDKTKKDKSLVKKEEALEIIKRAVKVINNKTFNNNFSYQLKDDTNIDLDNIDNNNYKDQIESYNLSGSFDIDFDESNIEFYGEEETSSYINNNFQLLSSKTKVFNKDGFRISYNFTSSSFTARISKKINDRLNGYFDVTLSNIKPTYEWNYHDRKLESAFFKVAYKANEKIGISSGKYNNLYADFKNADKANIKSYLSSLFKKKEDKLDTTLTLCTIETPIPNVPTASICLDVLVNVYASGRAEIALSNSNNVGFEIKNGQFRLINDSDRDIDLVLKATTKATAGLNVSINSSNLRLMDIQTDAGMKAEISPTLHVYDEKGSISSQAIDDSYDRLDEAFEGNDNIKICGDVSLSWVLDLKMNSSKTFLYKLGLSKEIELLDNDAQVFGNLHHIENGQFVKKCTRKAKNANTVKKVEVNSEKLTLPKYSIAISVNEKYILEPSLPEGYSTNDIKYKIDDENVIGIESNAIIGKRSGCSKVRVYTSDDKYEVYLNVLVRYE